MLFDSIIGAGLGKTGFGRRACMQGIDLIKLYKSKRCLVVDDYPDMRGSMSRMLEKFGVVHIDTAVNGEDALLKCMARPYDIILADYNLGDGKNGQQVLEELRVQKHLSHNSIYMIVTAETTRDKVYSAIEYQPDAYLAKPFSAPALQKRLDSLLVTKQVLKPINVAADIEDYAQVIKLCLERIDADDRLKLSYQKIAGQYLLKNNMPQDALVVYQDVLANRDLSWASIGLGRAYMLIGEMDHAEAIFQDLVDKDCPFLEVYDCLADILAQKSQLLEAQCILEQAVDIAPDAILRQTRLGKYCELNDDLSRAEKAYRKVVRISQNSVFETADNYFQYVRCLNKITENKDGSDNKRFKEAQDTIGRVERRYRDVPLVQAQSRFVQAEVCAASGKTDQAMAALAEAEQAMHALDLDAKGLAELTLSQARALQSTGNETKAKEVLKMLSFQYPDDEELMEAIDNCLDEPVSDHGKKQIVEFNRVGKELFGQKDFVGAVDYFEQALRVFPNHIALNLNLANALVRCLSKDPSNNSYYMRLGRIIHKLSTIETSHEYFPTYSNIKLQFEQLDEPLDAEA